MITRSLMQSSYRSNVFVSTL